MLVNKADLPEYCRKGAQYCAQHLQDDPVLPEYLGSETCEALVGFLNHLASYDYTNAFAMLPEPQTTELLMRIRPNTKEILNLVAEIMQKLALAKIYFEEMKGGTGTYETD